jgi:hypothetical protein
MTEQSRSLALRHAPTLAKNKTLVGEKREITICDEDNRPYLHDGETPGGHALALVGDDAETKQRLDTLESDTDNAASSKYKTIGYDFSSFQNPVAVVDNIKHPDNSWAANCIQMSSDGLFLYALFRSSAPYNQELHQYSLPVAFSIENAVFVKSLIVTSNSDVKGFALWPDGLGFSTILGDHTFTGANDIASATLITGPSVFRTTIPIKDLTFFNNGKSVMWRSASYNSLDEDDRGYVNFRNCTTPYRLSDGLTHLRWEIGIDTWGANKRVTITEDARVIINDGSTIQVSASPDVFGEISLSANANMNKYTVNNSIGSIGSLAFIKNGAGFISIDITNKRIMQFNCNRLVEDLV